MKFGLDGKVCLVTGGTRGIGFEIARALLDEGAKVIICGRKQEGLDAAVNALNENPNLISVCTHIAKENDVDTLFDAIEKNHHRLDILINNVGMNLMTPGIADLEPGLWKKIIDTNLNGTFLCCRKAAHIMRDQGSGKIVSISSTAGSKAAPGMGIYGIAKAGIEMMTKVLASELAPLNIQVNAVAPGMVRTEFSKAFWSNEELLAHITCTIPLGRIAEIQDVLEPVLFLASEGSAYITGQTIMVDGGASAI